MVSQRREPAFVSGLPKVRIWTPMRTKSKGGCNSRK
jgi:hypothetical protein